MTIDEKTRLAVDIRHRLAELNTLVITAHEAGMTVRLLVPDQLLQVNEEPNRLHVTARIYERVDTHY